MFQEHHEEIERICMLMSQYALQRPYLYNVYKHLRYKLYVSLNFA